MRPEIKWFDNGVKWNTNYFEKLNKSEHIFNNPTSGDDKGEVEKYVANNKLS